MPSHVATPKTMYFLSIYPLVENFPDLKIFPLILAENPLRVVVFRFVLVNLSLLPCFQHQHSHTRLPHDVILVSHVSHK